MKEYNFIPVLLGSDRNVYGMAVSFHEQYNIRSIALGKCDFLETRYTKIIDLYQNKDIEKKEVFLKELKKIYENNKDKKLLLIACSDTYMKLIVENKKELEKYFLVPYIDEELMNKLVLKEEFYKTCEKYNLDYPKTKIIDKENISIDFNYPVIIKPSDSVSYFKTDFPGKKKVFIVYNENEYNSTINNIYNSSYKGNLIVQEYIEGDDTTLRVMNCYVNRRHHVTFMALGNILLEEKTPKSIGDYDAIIPTYDEELFKKMKDFLESINYVGYANFDFKLDKKTNTYKLFEINIRQGRSSSFTTVAGCNLTKYVVDDFIYDKDMETKYLKNDYLWTIVPKGVIFKYLKNEKLKELVKKLYQEKKVRNILFYKKDFSFKRYYFLILRTLNYYNKYKKYYVNSNNNDDSNSNNNKKSLGIIGNDYNKTTKLFNDIVMNTKAKTDQEHIIINIVLTKDIEKENILKNIKYLESIKTSYLIIDIDDESIKDFIKENTNLIIIDSLDKVQELHEDNII